MYKYMYAAIVAVSVTLTFKVLDFLNDRKWKRFVNDVDVRSEMFRTLRKLKLMTYYPYVDETGRTRPPRST